jgi:hypothetical protein
LGGYSVSTVSLCLDLQTKETTKTEKGKHFFYKPLFQERERERERERENRANDK